MTPPPQPGSMAGFGGDGQPSVRYSSFGSDSVHPVEEGNAFSVVHIDPEPVSPRVPVKGMKLGVFGVKKVLKWKLNFFIIYRIIHFSIFPMFYFIFSGLHFLFLLTFYLIFTFSKIKKYSFYFLFRTLLWRHHDRGRYVLCPLLENNSWKLLNRYHRCSSRATLCSCYTLIRREYLC